MEAALDPPRNMVTNGTVRSDSFPARNPEMMFPSKQKMPKQRVFLKTLPSKVGVQVWFCTSAGKRISSCTVAVTLGYLKWNCWKRMNSSGSHNPRPKKLKNRNQIALNSTLNLIW